MRYSHVAAVALLVATGTVVVGWWTVSVIAGVWGLLAHQRRRPGWTAAIGAALAWTVLLGWSLVAPSAWTLATRVGGVFGIGSIGWFALTLLFPLALGGTAATFTATVKRILR